MSIAPATIYSGRLHSMGSRQDTIPAAWKYLAYRSDSDPEAFGPMGPIVQLWRSKWKHDSGFPRWRDFDLLELKGWWGQLSLAEVHRTPFDLKWILWGSRLVEWWGAEYTNQLISQQPYLGNSWHRNEKPYLETLVDKRLIGFVSGTLAPQDRDYRFVHGVDLPLEIDGNISHILSAYMLREEDDEFQPGITPVASC